jgi:hypothetical protein
MNRLGGGLMLRMVRFCAVAAITTLLFVASLISVTHFDVAQAQSRKERAAAALACGQQMQKLCAGAPVFGNNGLECLRKEQDKLSRTCAASANNIVRRCDRDAMRLCSGIAAGPGNILSCLTTARRSVSKQCNAALDAVFLR